MKREKSLTTGTKPVFELGEFVAPGVTALNNRTWGVAIRSALGIDNDELLQSAEEITIIVSREISSINAVFFEELFENIVHKLGENGFKKKFRVAGEGQYTQEKIDYYVDQAVSRILNYANVE